MKSFFDDRLKKQVWIVVLFVSFVIGIIYANVSSHQLLDGETAFQEKMLHDCMEHEMTVGESIWRTCTMRFFPFLFVSLLGNLKWKKTVVASCVCWFGFAMGMLYVMAILSLGIKGIFVCLAAVFPQIICYLFSYAMLLGHLNYYPRAMWNYKKIAIMLATFFIGIVLELSVNPSVMKFVIRSLHI